MNHITQPILIIAAACAVMLGSFNAKVGLAADAQPGVVTNIKVVSDKVPDVSSFEAWKESFIHEGMSDQEKGIAIWQSIITFQYQDSPPAEMIHHENIVYDPIKMFNVYGYAMCSPHSAHFIALARANGFPARGWAINAHSVPELFYDGGWRLFDPSLMSYFLKDDGSVAGVEEMIAAVQEWYEQNPEFTNISAEERDKRLRAFERTEGRQAWKTRGPRLIANSPSYDQRGWWPAGTHGWYATMQEYDGTAGDREAFVYEYGASMGYQVNIQLRPGERITRNWGHKGLHVNMDRGGEPDAMHDKSGFLRNNQAFVDKLDPSRPNLTNGRIGNGTHEYDVPLGSGQFRGGALEVENLASDPVSPALRLEDSSGPGVLVLRMPSSYVYLDGKLSVDTVVGAEGQVTIEFSDTHGRSWKPLATIDATGQHDIDLGELVLRRYDYRLRFTLAGAGTGLDGIRISHDIQHSQRPLPALAQGSNQLSFSAGPQESTITIEANNVPDHGGKQVSYQDWGARLENLQPNLAVSGREGSLTVPISTPGDMTRLRFGGYYRTWGDEEAWTFEVSFDDGQTFHKAGEGPPQKFGRTAWVTYDDVPAGTRSALIRYVGTSRSANMLGSFRIDADYTDPAFGFRPVKITYVWDENGEEKRHEHVAHSPEESYAIHCEQPPTMKSIILELAE